ncbi:MAG TPA: rhodanese-like domain-containing protein [Phycisphaerae bacterium]|nr:rhodanese-like domain-containing protein [Phycisphaerae bacterium]
MNGLLVRQISARSAALIVASVVIGIAFNKASPLGVQWKKQDASSPPHVSRPEAGQGIYSNTTLSVKVIPAATGPVQQPPAVAVAPPPVGKPPIYSNETLSVKAVPGTAGPPADPPKRAKDPSAPAAITWQEAKELLSTNDAMLVDARPRAAFQAGSIPGAVSLPLATMKDEMPEFAKKYGVDTVIIVYCGDADCSTSERSGKTLMKDYGYRNVMCMPGGYVEWQKTEAAARAAPQEKKQ